MSQLDLFGARAARDAGIALVSRNAGQWFNDAKTVVAGLPRGWTGTGEDVRLHVRAIIGDPHNQHAWGALVMVARRRGWLVPTGERRAMRTEESHSRSTDVYRVPASATLRRDEP